MRSIPQSRDSAPCIHMLGRPHRHASVVPYPKHTRQGVGGLVLGIIRGRRLWPMHVVAKLRERLGLRRARSACRLVWFAAGFGLPTPPTHTAPPLPTKPPPPTRSTHTGPAPFKWRTTRRWPTRSFRSAGTPSPHTSAPRPSLTYVCLCVCNVHMGWWVDRSTGLWWVGREVLFLIQGPRVCKLGRGLLGWAWKRWA